ncbi:hypothetical protein Tsubulata_025796 [Turnera subulata]|uniref:F-box domain-containing protein n=1 Tax=Turnera subulata TaxID=218843 RepID=A0A9Q0FTW1_9ROSI|nr:hypothetical protein Tsubulata_025796 [Turnera subulata]
MGDPNKSKRNRAAKPDGEVDRLSNLPDFIIHQILGFLPDTKFAAQTCVLSKRWKNLWTSVSDLRFDTIYFSKNLRSFEKFMLYALLRRDHHSTVRTLALSINYKEGFGDEVSSGFDVAGLINWVVQYAVDHGVRHVYLSSRSMRFRPSPALLGCRALKTLELNNADVSGLSSACLPAVTNLVLKECFFDEFLYVTESTFPNLANLDICVAYGIDDSVTKLSGTKLVYLKMEGLCCDEVQLAAPNLQVFKFLHKAENGYGSGWIMDFLDVDLPSVQYAEVLFYECVDPAVEGNIEDQFLRLLDGIRNAVSLTLRVPPLKVC